MKAIRYARAAPLGQGGRGKSLVIAIVVLVLCGLGTRASPNPLFSGGDGPESTCTIGKATSPPAVPPRARASGTDFGEYLETFESLYVEQLVPEVQGHESLVHAAVATDDPAFLPGIDFTHPDFADCSLFFTLSNGAPHPFSVRLAESPEERVRTDANNSATAARGASRLEVPLASHDLIGFLYFEDPRAPANPDVEALVSARQARIVALLENFLGVNLALLTPLAGPGYHFQPFVGCTRATGDVQRVTWTRVVDLLEIDGYFQYLARGRDRLLDASAFPARYLESSLFFLDELQELRRIDALLEDLGSPVPYDLETQALHHPVYRTLSEWLALPDTLSDGTPAGATGPYLEGMREYLEDLDHDEMMDGRRHVDEYQDVVLFDLIHEPLDNATEAPGPDEYAFSLQGALDLPDAAQLAPPARMFDSALGWLGGVDLVLHDAEVTTVTTTTYSYHEENLLPLRYALFVEEEEEEYEDLFQGELEVKFRTRGTRSQLELVPEYLDEDIAAKFDVIGYVAPVGFPVISGFLVGAIAPLGIEYRTGVAGPRVQVTKTFSVPGAGLPGSSRPSSPAGPNATLGPVPHGAWSNDTTVMFHVAVRNTGDTSVWGVPIRVLEKYGLTNTAPSGLITNALRTLGYDPAAMFDPVTAPRYFPVDPFGDGLYVGYSPDLTDLSETLPYSPEFAAACVSNAGAIAGLTPYTRADVVAFAQNYNRTGSIYNPANWVIPPGANLVLEYTCDLPRPNYTRVAEVLAGASSPPSNYSHDLLRPARVKIGSASGYAVREVTSNAIVVTREHNFSAQTHRLVHAMSAFANVTPGRGQPGDAARYNLTIENWGVFPLGNVNVTVARPFVTWDAEDLAPFQASASSPSAAGPSRPKLTLGYHLPVLGAHQRLENVTFRFPVPNTFRLAPALLEWSWPVSCPRTRDLVTDGGQFHVQFTGNLTSGSAVMSAPVIAGTGASGGPTNCGNLSRPRLALTGTPDFLDRDVAAGDLISVTYTLENTGTTALPTARLRLPFNPGDPVGSTLTVQALDPAAGFPASLPPGDHETLTVTYAVRDPVSYLVPPLVLVGSEVALVTARPCNATILGWPGLRVTKAIPVTTGTPGTRVPVSVTITNTGNLTLSGVILDDTRGYDARSFTLVAGVLRVEVARLAPNASAELNYMLEVTRAGAFTLHPCRVNFAHVTPWRLASNALVFWSVPVWEIVVSLVAILGIGTLLFQGRKRARLRLSEHRDSPWNDHDARGGVAE